MASSPIISWQIEGKKMEAVTDFIFLVPKITAGSDCSYEIKKHFLPGRKDMTNLDSILKSRDITVPTKVKVKSLSHVRLFETPWTVAYQAPPSMGFSKQEYWSWLPFPSSSMGFSRQEYWSGLPFPSPGDLPDPGVEPWSPAFQADTLTSEPPGKYGLP